ncbi:pyridine nucleotide transhydrogenase [Planktothrix sp. FACHB-1355]|uniref:Pyridine nucleotide transhydrogenase n=1 Tax=Aerosakkonema funiforme FACHB-1375 TaxID=2949571 RepID=A0A926VA75_9CYAN|nr:MULTISPECIES: pyridine nucleotide transhydrogenase [Oscillatoriales]MBD2180103.1 pyridine nucleotide transhydrogenase [Aerosakkonema funiforme FACHB-1375]MBD3558552.1 pyridine nucleotide transhydrogenase [Planktothrix sp. FACHB-1355]
MRNALIGYTGFVGGNLISQHQFDDLYNSKNIESIADKNFDFLVCSGAPAVKWLANKEPVKDAENLARLMNCLSQVSAKKVVLISTVDVYPVPIEVDEATEIDTQDLHPYGKHRLQLEQFVTERFDTLVVRLPGLFGDGLKKNIVYDFIHNNNVDQIHKDNIFQFYNLAHLWQDIQTALANNLKLVNLATEPTSVAEVAKKVFEIDFVNETHNRPVKYDMRTKYADMFGESGVYAYTKNTVLTEMKQFVLQQSSVVKS